ncbi:MAG: thioredoxin [candidate division Zixibacteria bacterium]|nr:thioredoxin [candidate division Zixibacteria bacterium]
MGIFKKLFGDSDSKPKDIIEVTEETFEEEVRCSEIPVIVDFWSSTCSPCKVMSGLLREVAPQYRGKLKFAKLNIDRDSEVARLYQIRSVPTIVAFKNGRPQDVHVGVLPLNQLNEWIDSKV